MIAVVRCYKHITPVIVTVFEKNDEQTPYLLSYNAPS